jgi:hypothetical protein
MRTLSDISPTLLKVALVTNFGLLWLAIFGSLLGLLQLWMSLPLTQAKLADVAIASWFVVQSALHGVAHVQGWRNYGVNNDVAAISALIAITSFCALLLLVWALYW